ncbi:cell wall metabolism sensor histidine kinase WalK [Sphingobacterium sp. JUb56]|uniref:sensor histidine kinase n=1 Tax=Sphingobacterium sp. JUb56 TaxID=2587145 RepID=UPI001621D98F|nr:HAMP domain-containing sensor histidine kinase [Sphingobacterium sp. JUb56]MBB2951654.1 signal transduction histidine kinase [Sphingobacterium sp. JUb56]
MKKKLKLILVLVLLGGMGILLILGTWLYASYKQRMGLFLTTAEQSLYMAIHETIAEKQELDHDDNLDLPDSRASLLPVHLVQTIVKKFPQIQEADLQIFLDSLYHNELRVVSTTRSMPAVAATMHPVQIAGTVDNEIADMLWNESVHRRIAVPLFSFLGDLSDQESLNKIEKRFHNDLLVKGIDIKYDLKVVPAAEDSTLLSGQHSVVTRRSVNDGEAVTTGTVSSLSIDDTDPYARKFITVDFLNPWQFFFYSLSWQLIISLIMVWIIIGSFVYLFHTLLKQNKLEILRKAFVNNLTHELRTPVTTVSVALQALDGTVGTLSDQISYHHIASEELDRLSSMIDKVLQIAEDDLLMDRQLDCTEYDLIALIQKCISSARVSNNQHDVKFVFSPSTDSEYMLGDSQHMRNVIANLIENAIKYGADEVHIVLQIKKEDFVTLSIQDNGIGIESAYHDQVFEPFFRVPEGDLYTVKGFGLGLAYVQQIVHQHGGTIKLKSVLHEGSTFIISIPKKMKK